MQDYYNNFNDLFKSLIEIELSQFQGTQVEFCAIIGIDPATLNRWRLKDGNPRKKSASAILNTLGYEVEKLDKGFTFKKIAKISHNENSHIESNCGEILLNVLREIMNEASEADRAVLGPHFLEISHRLNQRLKHGQ